MRKVKLNQGKHAIVDDADFEFLNQWKWTAHKGKYTCYAERSENIKIISMHRLIMNTPEGKFTDHIDGNGLNNQRGNLRICTKSQNGMNKKIQKNNTSGYKGVSWNKQDKKWVAHIKINKVSKHLGYFNIKEKAVRSYNQAAKKYFGNFARLNKYGDN